MRFLADSLRIECGVAPEARLIVAVSGGADSLAALATLAALAARPDLGYLLTVAHVHHHLRPEADLEAEAVESIARDLALPFERIDLSPGGRAAGRPARLRRMRYEALADLQRRLNADAVVTGHHATDQLETVLLALVRGAGIAGLSGMPWRSSVHGATVVRPMLRLPHSDCVELLTRIGWRWFEDPTNARLESPRANVRANVLPALRSIAPDIERRVQRMCDQMTALDSLVQAEVERVFGSSDRETGNGLDRAGLRNASPIILGAGLRREAIALGAAPDRLTALVVGPAVAAIRDEDRRPRRFDWPGGVVVHVTSREVRIAKERH